MLTDDQVAAINTAMQLGPLALTQAIIAARDALPSFEEQLSYWNDARHYLGL